MCLSECCARVYFFFNDTATTEIYTLSLHDALPIFTTRIRWALQRKGTVVLSGHSQGSLIAAATLIRLDEDELERVTLVTYGDRKSTRLNSSHANISYAVFCLKKK